MLFRLSPLSSFRLGPQLVLGGAVAVAVALLALGTMPSWFPAPQSLGLQSVGLLMLLLVGFAYFLDAALLLMALGVAVTVGDMIGRRESRTPSQMAVAVGGTLAVSGVAYYLWNFLTLR